MSAIVNELKSVASLAVCAVLSYKNLFLEELFSIRSVFLLGRELGRYVINTCVKATLIQILDAAVIILIECK